ncbi:MAG: DoxX family protein [Actinomycetota bacterium]|nr:DoxX family protein [Actinomycetota bacterium]
MRLIRKLARPLLAWLFIHSGFDVYRNPGPRVGVAGPTLDRIRDAVPALPDDHALVRANAVVQVVAGGFLAVGAFPRLAALGLACSLVPTTIGGHAFWDHDDPKQRAQQQLQFDKNLAILGGLLTVAAGRD